MRKAKCKPTQAQPLPPLADAPSGGASSQADDLALIDTAAASSTANRLRECTIPMVDSGSQKGTWNYYSMRAFAYQQALHRVVVPGALFESQSLDCFWWWIAAVGLQKQQVGGVEPQLRCGE
jgi:hypothetical protein